MDYAIVARHPGKAEVLEQRPIQIPSPKNGEVVLWQTAIELNYIDVYHRSGAYPWAQKNDLIVGSEAAGIVVAVGEGVDNLVIGDRVAYTDPLNAYATCRTISADRLVRLPDGISDEVGAAIMLKGLTAHYLIHDTFAVQAGQTVLVHAAAGGVGVLLGQWLRAKGVRAIGTAGGPEKCAIARSHGYDDVIDYTSDDFVPIVRDMTQGKGVDAVYDSVGQSTWRGSVSVLRTHGHFVNFGQSSGPITDFTLGELAKGSFHACRPVLFHYISKPDELARRGKDLFDAIQTGILACPISNRFSLENAADAHRALEARSTTGLSVLVP